MSDLGTAHSVAQEYNTPMSGRFLGRIEELLLGIRRSPGCFCQIAVSLPELSCQAGKGTLLSRHVHCCSKMCGRAYVIDARARV